ncbi:MAG: hypothetical protein QOH61_2679 [Chloroflexota bacterium]|jgi:ElaB/YqjD/DUF883 family membrane-anchored ribosome-binding protein|nr:hypothetical protein [Chloroflexota bacterium]
MARNTVQEDDRTDAETAPLQDRALEAIRGANETVRQTANVVAERAPEAINEASRRLQSGSPEALTSWAAFGMGLWIGLLLGRAPRLFVLAAGLPALVLAGALLARREAPDAEA